LQSIARREERDGGVYVELEAIGLTRDIPVSLSLGDESSGRPPVPQCLGDVAAADS
jgi:hypothetical protein